MSQINQILSYSFNQDHSCFAIGHSKGFAVYRTSTLETLVSKEFDVPIRLIRFYFKSNILALSLLKEGFGKEKLVLFDLTKDEPAGHAKFSQQVIQVKFTLERMIAVLQKKTVLFSFPQLKALDFKDTYDNPKGIAGLVQFDRQIALAVPGIERGTVQISFYNEKRIVNLKSHQSDVAAIQFMVGGQRIITSSQKGTNLRIFDCLTGQLIQQVVRGNQYATIYSLVSNPTGQWFAVASDSQNIHLFIAKLSEREEQGQCKVLAKNPSSLFRCFKFLYPSLAHQRSFSVFKIPNYSAEMKCSLGFCKETHCLVILTNKGELLKAGWDPLHGGSMKLLQQKKFI